MLTNDLCFTDAVETHYNEHVNKEFNRYNAHTFLSTHVKIMLCAMRITYEFSGSPEHSFYQVFTLRLIVSFF